MTNSAFAVKPERIASEQVETRNFTSNEVAGVAIPCGTVIIKYRGLNLDSFPGVPAEMARKMVEEVHDARTFSGSLKISTADRIGVINMAEVESITFRQDQCEAQP
ncbi:hypothetical protein [Paracoccus methylarcula]|uniref:Uncharacterized protein n=1 Tax=Paracoccus methylarcula TaxID=72022 RepID=A0A422QSF0_9RHOB|nr:hypothetical protein [Paracoccus methylarcula]RNF32924.1 hypothetical protein A7A09_019110 [Paracoccus methylarcula]